MACLVQCFHCHKVFIRGVIIMSGEHENRSKFSRFPKTNLAVTFMFYTRRASRGHEAARSEKLLRLLSDRAQTLHNDRTFYSKQSYRFCFFILTAFGGEMTSRCKRQIFNCLLWHKKYVILKELIEIK